MRYETSVEATPTDDTVAGAVTRGRRIVFRVWSIVTSLWFLALSG